MSERDWDNLVVLDACRYDLFAEVLADHPLPGSLSRRRACASGTPDFLAHNFGGTTLHDVVYVTANPYVATELPKDTFHAVDHVWRDGWDEANGTVQPETMRDRTLAAAADYPEKRIVAHFNQPHVPFVGDERLAGRGMTGIRRRALDDEVQNRGDRDRTPFEKLGAGEVSREALWRAYRANLEVVMPPVEDLLGELEGLTAITADHGNAVGERAWPFPVRVYGHPLGILIPALTEVPWFVGDTDGRKEVSAAPPAGQTDTVDEVVEDRLRGLGYAE